MPTEQQIIQNSILMQVIEYICPKDSAKVSNWSESYKLAELLTCMGLAKNGKKCAS